jgi:hypothetical protein
MKKHNGFHMESGERKLESKTNLVHGVFMDLSTTNDPRILKLGEGHCSKWKSASLASIRLLSSNPSTTKK